MFKQNDQNINDKEVETIIGPSVKVEGDFVGEGNVIVEGIMNGTVKTKRNLKVGSGAKIYANVKATNALISGEISGNISVSETLELTETAKIKGDIKASIVIISAGAIFNGKCEMGKAEEAKLKKEKGELAGSVSAAAK